MREFFRLQCYDRSPLAVRTCELVLIRYASIDQRQYRLICSNCLGASDQRRGVLVCPLYLRRLGRRLGRRLAGIFCRLGVQSEFGNAPLGGVESARQRRVPGAECLSLLRRRVSRGFKGLFFLSQLPPVAKFPD